ncbi:MAG: adenylate/guanylate cyclase domain-containing protein [Candidatus Dormibacteraceae bacterium]
MRAPIQYAPSGELKIAYQVTGAGPVDVVWAPAMATQLDLEWDWPPRARFLESLGSFCRLIRFDKRGTGLSDRPDHIATLDERIDDIRAVIDAAGSQSPAILGASEGASMACLFAATHPDRTRALLIWGGQARWVKTDDYPWGITREEDERGIAALSEHGITLDWEFPDGVPEDQMAYAEYLVRWHRAGASPAALVALARMNSQIDVRDILPEIRVPTLVMNRTGDPVAHVDAARDLASHIPGARFLEFPGDTHSISSVEPEKVLAAIEEFITGAPSRLRTTRVLASILVLDTVGSTKRVAEIGDVAWRDLLHRSRAMTDAQVAYFGGAVVDHAGDGMLATFDGPARAVRCARASLDSARELGLQLRAGVHTGEVERDGPAASGIAVHLAARVGALAAADEVLVTSTVRDLVAGSGIEFEDRGRHMLKGVPEARRIYRVLAV